MSLAGRKVLVTGADGFIGSHLVERLLELGADVRALCFYNSRGSWGFLDELEGMRRERLDVRLGDIRDARFVEETCRGVEIVLHLAALISIPYSYLAPESFLDTNLRGTLNVLEAVRRCGCARLVHTSTSEVYGTPDSLPIRETHPLRAQSPYAASKIAADKLCEAYACAHDTPVVVLRPFNTYGPRQSARAILPTILGQLLHGAREVRLGSLTPRRDFTFVSDTVEGFVAAATAPGLAGGEVVQLGTGLDVSVKDLFDAACRALGRQAEIAEDPARVRPERSEVLALRSDPSRAAERLGWRAGVGLEEGLRRTAAWMAEHLDGIDANRYHL